MRLTWLLAETLIAVLIASPVTAGAQSSSSPAQAASEKSAAELRKELADTGKAIKAYAADQREDAVRTAKAALDSLDQKLDALERRLDEGWEKMEPAARAKARQAMRELRRQRIEAAERFGALKEAAPTAWDRLKNGFMGAYDALGSAWERTEQDVQRASKE